MNLKTLLKTNSKYLTILTNNGINTIKDFFEYYPRSYEDRSTIKRINELMIDGTTQSAKGTIIDKKMINTQRGKKLVELILQDENGDKMQLNFLNTTYALRGVEKNKIYIAVGKPQLNYGKIVMWYPEIINSGDDSGNDDIKVGRIYPIYSEMMGIKPAWFTKKMRENISIINDVFKENLPNYIIKEYNLPNKIEQVINLHFPENFEKLNSSKFRLFFEKLLKIQLISLINKLVYEQSFSVSNILGEPDREIIKNFIDMLPFELTKAQKKSLKQIIDDFHIDKPMLRLLQGDVGSGKTIVSAIGAYYIIKKFKGQVAFLAPTEVLANQHLAGISKFLLPLGVRIDLLTGSTTKKLKDEIKEGMRLGKIQVIVGTHALIQEGIEFDNLKFAIIDEQHKFGVMQRGFFKRFGSPHILQMTATPIPRSMALAFFGEFDVSIIDELPAGRREIVTKIISEVERKKMKPWILTKINQGQKMYIITPLIEDSEKMDDLTSATTEYENIKSFLPELEGEIGLLHGKIKPKDKDDIMIKFKKGEYKILVSTTVIEVGIDVPDATIIIIKDADRFGLSQLHQLRGRVGRSDLQSYCFLIANKKSSESIKRLKAMEKYSDGFKLAELDMEYRGTGEIMGTRQAGETDIPAEILGDFKFLEKVQKAAREILNKNNNLDGLEELKNELNEGNSNILI